MRHSPAKFASRILFVTIFLSAFFQIEINAQDFEKIAPKVPNKNEDTVNLPTDLKEIKGSEKILVEKVSGFVFVQSMQEVKKQGLSGVKGIRTSGYGMEILQRPAFKEIVDKYIDQPLSIQKLNELIRDVILYYRENDLPLVNVIVPEQDITTGVVQVVVLRGKAGAVTVEGNHWFNTERLRENIRLRTGEEVSGKTLIQDINWINSNPFHEANLVFSPGKYPGTTDISVRVKDRFPVRFFAGYEDTGNDLTGDERWLAGFNWGDAFGCDQQLNYQFTGDSHLNKFIAHSGSWLIPLPWRHRLTFFGSYVETTGDTNPLISLTGSSWQASTRYSIPLPSLGDYVNVLPFVRDYVPQLLKDVVPVPVLRDYVHELVLGFDYKQSNNNLEFGGTQVFNQTTEVDQLVIGYDSGLKDPWGSTSFDINWYISPGYLSDKNTDARFRASRAFSGADYIYERASAERLTKLPWDFSWILRATEQFSPSGSNLLGSEQLGVGGYNTVRGYDEREANGDEGYLFSSELRTPAISPAKDLGWIKNRDQLQFLGFFDYGVAQNNYLLPGEDPNVILESAGPGVRYSISPFLTMRADYGFQLKDTGFNPRYNSRLHLGIVLSY
jgi:hemolysin activation/secretion protein